MTYLNFLHKFDIGQGSDPGDIDILIVDAEFTYYLECFSKIFSKSCARIL